jgi:hypothetical protein
VPTRAELRAHLIASRIAGDVATARDNNLANYRRCSIRDPLYTFGLDYDDSWTPTRILALMADRVGVSREEAFTEGVDRIDPDRTIDALDRMAERLRLAAERKERVLLATGHPTGVFAIHAAVACALAARGCALLAPASGHSYPNAAGHQRQIRHLAGVAMASGGADLTHTHSPYPMQVMLAALAEAGAPPPDLVVADHGFAGAAGEAGVDSVGYADCNDPALFIGEALGKVLVAVPLDDNVLPHLYAPVTAYLLEQAGLGELGLPG